jgi:DUF971 family protein
MTDQDSPHPVEIKLRSRSKRLDVRFSDGLEAELSAEYLRVHSPSAEVKGHAVGEGLLVSGKRDVGISRIEPVGRYAVRIVFDDSHATGLYTWPILYELSRNQERNWERYLERLAQAGQSRESRIIRHRH